MIRGHEKMKISEVLSSGKGTSQKNIMTSDVEKESFYATELSNGIEGNKIKLSDGDLDVRPSTYPSGCPINSIDLLNKKHTQS